MDDQSKMLLKKFATALEAMQRIVAVAASDASASAPSDPIGGQIDATSVGNPYPGSGSGFLYCKACGTYNTY